jgi:hypothetical protein
MRIFLFKKLAAWASNDHHRSITQLAIPRETYPPYFLYYTAFDSTAGASLVQ